MMCRSQSVVMSLLAIRYHVGSLWLEGSMAGSFMQGGGENNIPGARPQHLAPNPEF